MCSRITEDSQSCFSPTSCYSLCGGAVGAVTGAMRDVKLMTLYMRLVTIVGHRGSLDKCSNSSLNSWNTVLQNITKNNIIYSKNKNILDY